MSNIKKEALKDDELDEVVGGVGVGTASTMFSSSSPVVMTGNPVTVNETSNPVTLNTTGNPVTVNETSNPVTLNETRNVGDVSINESR